MMTGQTSPVSGPEKLLEELERATYVTLHGVNWTLGLGSAEQRTLIDALRKSRLAQRPDLQQPTETVERVLEFLKGCGDADIEATVGYLLRHESPEVVRKFRAGIALAIDSAGPISPDTSTDRQPLEEATAAQHSGLPKGEPARFVRNGVLRTCQCRDCRAVSVTSPDQKPPGA